MNKEKWIEDIIQSGKNLAETPVNSFLATRVEAKLQALKEKNDMPVRWVCASALAMIALLVLNVLIWNSTGPSTKKNAGIQQVMQEYGWDNNDIYTTNFSK